MCRVAAGYEKIAKIGEGAFGVVSKATQISTGRTVAIKKLKMRKADAQRPGIDLTMLREIMLLQELHHKNVIELVDVYWHNESISLVFEYCKTDLEQVIKDKDAVLDLKQIQTYMLGSLRGLAYCHSNWVLHRDLKPGNLLLDSNGVVKLADFGLARLFGSPERKLTGQVRSGPLHNDLVTARQERLQARSVLQRPCLSLAPGSLWRRWSRDGTGHLSFSSERSFMEPPLTCGAWGASSQSCCLGCLSSQAIRTLINSRVSLLPWALQVSCKPNGLSAPHSLGPCC